jgi:hypothetical protein
MLLGNYRGRTDIQTNGDIFKCIRDNNGIYYELNYFMHLLSKGSIQPIEMLFVPDKKILHLTQAFSDMVRKPSQREVFITKAVYNTFRNYVEAEMNKWKKITLSLKRKEEFKTILDFCKVYKKTELLNHAVSSTYYEFVEKENETMFHYNHNGYGVTQIDENAYNLYYDYSGQMGGPQMCTGMLKEGSDEEFEVATPSTTTPYRGLLIVDRKGWKQYKATKDKISTIVSDLQEKDIPYYGKSLAHTWRILEEAIQLFNEGHIQYPLSQTILEQFGYVNKTVIPMLSIVSYTARKLKLLEQLCSEKTTLTERVDPTYVEDLIYNMRQTHWILSRDSRQPSGPVY